MCFTMLTIELIFHGLLLSGFVNKAALYNDIENCNNCIYTAIFIIVSIDGKKTMNACMLLLSLYACKLEYNFCYSVSFLLCFFSFPIKLFFISIGMGCLVSKFLLGTS